MVQKEGGKDQGTILRAHQEIVGQANQKVGVLLEQSLQAQRGGDLQRVRVLVVETSRATDFAAEIQDKIASAEVHARESGIPDLPVEDFLRAVLLELDSPYLELVTTDPEISKAIRARLPREKVEEIKVEPTRAYSPSFFPQELVYDSEESAKPQGGRRENIVGQLNEEEKTPSKLLIDESRKTVVVGETESSFAGDDWEILLFLARNAKEPVTTKELKELIQDTNSKVLVGESIRRIREVIEDVAHPKYLASQGRSWGTRYILNMDVEFVPKPEEPVPDSSGLAENEGLDKAGVSEEFEAQEVDWEGEGEGKEEGEPNGLGNENHGIFLDAEKEEIQSREERLVKIGRLGFELDSFEISDPVDRSDFSNLVLEANKDDLPRFRQPGQSEETAISKLIIYFRPVSYAAVDRILEFLSADDEQLNEVLKDSTQNVRNLVSDLKAKPEIQILTADEQRIVLKREPGWEEIWGNAKRIVSETEFSVGPEDAGGEEEGESGEKEISRNVRMERLVEVALGLTGGQMPEMLADIILSGYAEKRALGQDNSDQVDGDILRDKWEEATKILNEFLDLWNGSRSPETEQEEVLLARVERDPRLKRLTNPGERNAVVFREKEANCDWEEIWRRIEVGDLLGGTPEPDRNREDLRLVRDIDPMDEKLVRELLFKFDGGEFHHTNLRSAVREVYKDELDRLTYGTSNERVRVLNQKTAEAEGSIEELVDLIMDCKRQKADGVYPIPKYLGQLVKDIEDHEVWGVFHDEKLPDVLEDALKRAGGYSTFRFLVRREAQKIVKKLLAD